MANGERTRLLATMAGYSGQRTRKARRAKKQDPPTSVVQETTTYYSAKSNRTAGPPDGRLVVFLRCPCTRYLDHPNISLTLYTTA